MVNHENKFITGLFSGVASSAIESYLVSAPAVDPPFYLIFDATNMNGHYEEVYITGKTGTKITHSPLKYSHTVDEYVLMSFSTDEYAGIQSSIATSQLLLNSFSGEILLWATQTAPTGFLLCDGSAISRTTYATLFSSIGTTYGAGDGSTTFNLPNIKSSSIFGYNSSDTDFNSVGKSGGNSTINIVHSHTTNTHTHYISGNTNAYGADTPKDIGSVYFGIGAVNHYHWFGATSGGQSNAGTTSSLSSAQSIQNPYITLQFIIRY